MSGRLRLSAMIAFGCAATALASPAQAAREIGPVIASACSGNPTGEVLRKRLAEAVLAQAGVLGSELLGDSTLVSYPDFGDRAIAAVFRGEVQTYNDSRMDILALRQRLEQYLGPKSNVSVGDRKLEVVAPPEGANWLFDRSRTIVLRCIGSKPAKPIITEFEEGTKRSAFAVREKVDELALAGDASKKAGSAKIGLVRTRTEKDDGTRKTVTSLTLNGTAGLRLTGPTSQAPLYVYGSYALSQERTRPADDPTKDQSDGDVDALETGLSLNGLLLRSAADFSLVGSLQAAYVSDFAHNAERLKLRASLVPGFAVSVGRLCDIGGYNQVTALGLNFRTRCLIKFETEASHVLDAGTADFKDHGEFLAFGGTAAYQLAAPIGDKAEMISSLSYRYLPVIAGRAPNISRWDAMVKYRFWLDNGPGLDFGVTWGKGHEPISYTKEDKLELGFGIIF
jgi:hypothetical protein